MPMYALARSILFRLEPENAHNLALAGLRTAGRLLPGPEAPPTVGRRTVMGLEFPNPVGLAAGMDKDGTCIDGFARLGFGFIEVGTVTPRPQRGNARPRMFRLPRAEAVINRMGFNNAGAEALARAVANRRYRGILGVNIGKNAETPLERAGEDYAAAMQTVYGVADYLAVNISSPNTKGLRKLQESGTLSELIAGLIAQRDRLAETSGRRVPLAVKVAPDLDEDAIRGVARVLLETGVDGLIAANTTLSRWGVAGMPHAAEPGGLSGAPVRARSTDVIRAFAEALNGRIPIIGVGGIFSTADAKEKLMAGASLVQVYTGLVYRGPGLVKQILLGLETR